LEVIGYEVEFEEVSGEENDFAPVRIPEGQGAIPGNESNTVYFSGSLNGNFLASYGGLLTYVVNSYPDETSDRETFAGPDVILEGYELPPSTKTLRLMYFSIDHLDGDHAMNVTLRIRETDFVVVSATGNLVSATRDQLMIVLKGLKSIYLRAGYWKNTRETAYVEYEYDTDSQKCFKILLYVSIS
jgi:hypothetical protein